MYVRFLIARYGKLRAKKIARQKMEALKQKGDLSGQDVWQDVAQLLEIHPSH